MKGRDRLVKKGMKNALLLIYNGMNTKQILIAGIGLLVIALTASFTPQPGPIYGTFLIMIYPFGPAVMMIIFLTYAEMEKREKAGKEEGIMNKKQKQVLIIGFLIITITASFIPGDKTILRTLLIIGSTLFIGFITMIIFLYLENLKTNTNGK